ncbi:MAG: hypothetical protein Q8P78_01835 [bacterium]|nr:hypothetical protein [bacterium]
MFRRPDPLAPIRALMPELTDLQQQMDYAEHCISCPLDRIVFFLDIVSKWHDRGLDDIIQSLEAAEPCYGEVLSHVSMLNAHFWLADRNQFGMNRTKPGEPVTKDNVFLGPNGGIPHPVIYWMALYSDPECMRVAPGMHPAKPCDVVVGRAKQFTAFHIAGICESIEALRTALVSEHRPQT